MVTQLPSVYACITTRDGSATSVNTYERVSAACEYAVKSGLCAAAQVNVSVCGYGVAPARNSGVAKMLHERRWTHLMFVDDDVHVAKDAIAELVRMDEDIAVGCYASWKNPLKKKRMCVPYVLVRFGRGDDLGNFAATWFDGIRECTAAGTGCMLIHRRVFETLGFPWFRKPEKLQNDGTVRSPSDDVDFCDRARAAGYRIFAHGNVRCSHFKNVDMATFIREQDEQPFRVSWDGPKTFDEQESFTDYASHMPVLMAIGEQFGDQIQSIVEYGSGLHSTDLFLDREKYPAVRHFVSYESDRHWAERVQQAHAEDGRLKVVTVPIEKMSEHVYRDADLAFIDCDVIDRSAMVHDYSARVDLLREYAECDHPIVIVHDANFAQLWPAIQEIGGKYRHKIMYRPRHGPQTCILSNEIDISGMQIRDVLRRTIERGGRKAEFAPVIA